MRFLAPFCILPVLTSAAILVNRTIDDQYGDIVTGALPTYAPSNQWAYGPSCNSCFIHPGNPYRFGAVVDVSQVYNGSWHDTTYHPNLHTPTITVTFVGQAVYVYSIIANTIANVTTLTSLVFTLDGEVVGHFKHGPDSLGPVLVYNIPVYVNSSIPYGDHTLKISTEAGTTSLLLFDYITYT
ncbi:uncharacterized protein TRAVEDRAFT_103451, partial [Trametes versicolor FP-101664 SS1]|uniref:uncharacterized protein n=1 Tax=Trametes versicolor (strain FP-101664) TaxID=717944 RepID=UPI0004623AA6